MRGFFIGHRQPSKGRHTNYTNFHEHEAKESGSPIRGIRAIRFSFDWLDSQRLLALWPRAA
ncbi:hypothetical protein [Oleiharenicola lentus]|uniref:hypothetical protein n=1 Tax=Oleiharenicola lentus TaxID=2508720 RepID=UPI003F66A990